MKGMIIGLVLSIALIAFFVILVTVSTQGVVDNPTGDIPQAALKAQTLPESLPPMFEPTGGSEPANKHYEALLEAYAAHRRLLKRPSPPTRAIEALLTPLTRAAESSTVHHGLLDDRIPLEPANSPSFEEAIEKTAALLDEYARDRAKVGQIREALDVNRALWALGERLFRHSVRLYNRRQGLRIMMTAGNNFHDWGGDVAAGRAVRNLEEKIEPWSEALNRIAGMWEPKIRVVRSIRPAIGDLLLIATEDEDPAFRIEATLTLGIAQHNPGSKGNLRGIRETLQRLKEDANPTIATAAENAMAFTKADMKGLR